MIYDVQPPAIKSEGGSAQATETSGKTASIPQNSGAPGTERKGNNSPVAGQETLRKDLLAQAIELFGTAQTARLESDHPPGSFLDTVKKSGAAPLPEFVALPCGPVTNLCALVVPFNNIKVMEAMANTNPWLQETVWTTWNATLFVWLRIEGWRPANRILSGYQWISSGLLPVVSVAGLEQQPYGFPVTGKGRAVITVGFEAIKWHANLHELFRLELVSHQYGKPFRRGARGRIALNAQMVARFFAELLQLKYSRRTGKLTFCNHDGQTEGIEKARLIAEILKWIHKQAAQASLPVPDGNPAEEVLTMLQQICAVDNLSEADGLHGFLREQVERKAGGTLTVKEVFAGYLAYCARCGAPVSPERIFYQNLTPAVREHFGVAKAHDIRRVGQQGEITLLYGFRNVQFKAAATEVAEPEEAAERSEPEEVH